MARLPLLSLWAGVALLSQGVDAVDCSDEEVAETLAFYLAVATNETCANVSSICSFDLRVNTRCFTDCAVLIEDLWTDLPQCKYEGAYLRLAVLNTWAQCDHWVYPDNVSISFHYYDGFNSSDVAAVGCIANNDTAASSGDTSSGDGSHATSSSPSLRDSWRVAAVAIMGRAPRWRPSADRKVTRPAGRWTLAHVAEAGLQSSLPKASPDSHQGPSLSAPPFARSFTPCGFTTPASTMQRVFGSVLLALTAVTALSSGGCQAAECSDAEAWSADDEWLWAATSSACSPYATQTSPVHVSVPCTATACISNMKQVADHLPDCTYNGVNAKTEVEEALTNCFDDTVMNARLLTVSAATTGASTTSSSTTDCTPDEYQSTSDLLVAAAETSACSLYGSDDLSDVVGIAAPCTATDCVDVLTQLDEDLPDCLVNGDNIKSYLSASLTACPSDLSQLVFVNTPYYNESSPSPASTASNTDCTYSQIREMQDLFNATVWSAACANQSDVVSWNIYIAAPCFSACADEIAALADALPNCRYENMLTNVKNDALNIIGSCASNKSQKAYVNLYTDYSITSSEGEITGSASGSSQDMSGASKTSSFAAVLLLLAAVSLVVQHWFQPAS